MVAIRKTFLPMVAVFILFTLDLFVGAIPLSSPLDPFTAATPQSPSLASFNNTTWIKPHNILKPPPQRPNESPSNTTISPHNPSCGLELPTTKSWEKYHPQIVEWFEKQWDLYLDAPGYKSFPLYFRDKFAPDASPSSQFCDTFGTCSIGSCLHLKEDLSQHDKQMAYFVFEQVSGLDHIFSSISTGIKDAADYVMELAHELVKKYTSAPVIDKKRREARKQWKLITAIFQGFGLMAGAGLGFAGPSFAVTRSIIDW